MPSATPLAVVTGATQGIGRAIAERLWDLGYDLAACARGREGLDALATDLRARRPTGALLVETCDVGVRAEVGAFAKTVSARWPRGVNALVNNAGTFEPGGLLDGEEDALERLLRVNLMSAFWLTRDLAAGLRQNRGRALVVNVCSVAGLAAYAPSGPYTVSKFALRGLGVALRQEFAGAGVAVTTVYPGATYSASWANTDVDPERLMAAGDVAEVVAGLTRLSHRAVVEEVVMRPQLGDL